jgi:hypothetical protein
LLALSRPAKKIDPISAAEQADKKAGIAVPEIEDQGHCRRRIYLWSAARSEISGDERVLRGLKIQPIQGAV